VSELITVVIKASDEFNGDVTGSAVVFVDKIIKELNKKEGKA
jgi:hypothetical protein